MFATPAITAIVIAVLAALAFSDGYALRDWQDGNSMRLLETEKGVLTAANNRCATDISEARAAYAALESATDAREQAAAGAMAAAEPQAKTHVAKARQLQAQPAVPLERQCDTIASEQIIYVQALH